MNEEGHYRKIHQWNKIGRRTGKNKIEDGQCCVRYFFQVLDTDTDT